MPGSAITRRLSFHSVMAMTVVAALTFPVSSLATPSHVTPSIAALDSRIIETLLAMEARPTALTDPESQYFAPPDVTKATNLGMNFQPNLELLDQVSPEKILTSPGLMHMASQLSHVANVEYFTPYSPDSETGSWQRMTTFTRELGHAIGAGAVAEDLIRETEEHFHSLRNRLADDRTPPLLIIRLMDHHHARVFGHNSLFQGALGQLGLVNAWQGQDNHWGFTTVSIDALIDIDARLVILESPYATSPVREQFTAQGTWQHLRSIQRGDAIYLPATFSHFGSLPSVRHFADLLVDALEES